jgi:hypothetical protein
MSIDVHRRVSSPGTVTALNEARVGGGGDSTVGVGGVTLK